MHIFEILRIAADYYRITIFVNLRVSLVSTLIYGPQQDGLMFGSSYLNHVDTSS